jgi:TM2 domain-containing membrane protein YozV
MNSDTTKHPGVAAVLSFVFNGLGQLYNGQLLKGLVIIFLSSVSMFIFIIGAILIGFWLIGKAVLPGQIILGGFLFFISLVFICILGIYSILDAYKSSLKK